ncbi:SDR family NAD(P)-dependent oxidoreductase [Prochlorococcus sp. MIT 1303]|uniref:SDR family NAD(P)-dependent oxidoreductase n=1 Tax=Prochlorococcus sp. MIT 1303 TaxID=1723647 RepID=UPI0007B39320|nr:SDR family NAD(P)-dependent oxidoreductase [Prochlorococcus sp. MIT 1303]KZR68956.1 3-oxoacyl-[acyl-carrier-protein] reductase FabG [Prochlorococcus sp. MIT 1303]
MKEINNSVLITGGCRGVGRAILEELIKDGYEIGVFEKDEKSCSKLRIEHGKNVKVWQCDVSSYIMVNETINRMWNSGFQPSTLINNAGIIHSEPLVNFRKTNERIHSVENWEKVLRNDLSSVFYMTGELINKLIEIRRKGVVVSISSIAAYGNSGQTAYSAAKAGVNALTKTWAKELGPMGFRFVGIAPGYLETNSTIESTENNLLERLKNEIPLRKLGDPSSIAQMIKAVITNEYINGAIIDINGGLTL